MSQETIIANTEVSFKDFLFKNKRNRTILWVAAVAIIAQWSAFKYFYPFASYIHGDSFSYLNAAEKNLDINTYLIGYSKFLRLFSVFNRTDYLLTSFQYLFIQYGALYLLFSLLYFYNISRTAKMILFCFMVFNPLFLHLGNLISSDGFFLSLSLIWFALLLWITHKPSTKILIWHAVILFIAFTVRYNAIIYPLVALLALYLSKISWRQKLIGIGLIVFLCGSFVSFTMYKYKKLTGHWQYSPFSGWQLANNAMYTYRYVESTERKPVSNSFLVLDKMVKEYFDSTRDTKKFPIETLKASTFYMWTPKLPLFKYRERLFTDDTTASEFEKWATMGPLFKSYGISIISTYPWHFVRHFVLPNAIKYYSPPVEFMQAYNSGKSFVTIQTKNWFGYKTTNVKSVFKNKKVWILNFYPILSGTVNVVMLFILICYLMLKGWNFQPVFKHGLMLGAGFWLLNASFTILASSAALRFQSFPIVLTTVFVGLLIDWMIKFMELMRKQRLSLLEQNKKTNKISYEAIA